MASCRALSILPRQYAESRRTVRTGAGEPQGPLQVPGANRTKPSVARSLSARARQLTPQAVEREGSVVPQHCRARAQIGGHGITVAVAALLATLPASAAAAIRPAARRPRRRRPRRRRARPARPSTDAPSAGSAAASSPPRPRPATPSTTASATRACASKSEAPRPRTTSASTSSTSNGGSRAQLLPQRRRTAHDRRRSAGTAHRDQATGAATATTASGSCRRAAPRVARRATSSSEPLSLSFDLYGYAFPILGTHDFGGAGGRFGAGRSGHTHEGQDVMADCGLPLVAARGGRVQYSATRDDRPATTSSSTARAPPTTPPTCTSPNPRR